jgi:hypothetical protein
MRTYFRISSLVTSGLLFQSVSDSTDSIILLVRSGAAKAKRQMYGRAKLDLLQARLIGAL